MSGIVDLLAVRKTRKELLILELKKKGASHRALGQLLRYMGDAAMLWPELSVHAILVALHAESRLELALAAVPSVTFYAFRVARWNCKLGRLPTCVPPWQTSPRDEVGPCMKYGMEINGAPLMS